MGIRHLLLASALAAIAMGAARFRRETVDLPDSTLDQLSKRATADLRGIFLAAYNEMKVLKETLTKEEKLCDGAWNTAKQTLIEKNKARLQNECKPCVGERCQAKAASCQIDKLPQSVPTCAGIKAINIGGATTDEEKEIKGRELFELCKFYMRQCPNNELFSETCTQSVLDKCQAKSRECTAAALPTTEPACPAVLEAAKTEDQQKIADMCLYYARTCPNFNQGGEIFSQSCIVSINTKCQARMKSCIPPQQQQPSSGFCGDPKTAIVCQVAFSGLPPFTAPLVRPLATQLIGAGESAVEYLGSSEFSDFVTKDVGGFFSSDFPDFITDDVADFVEKDIGGWFAGAGRDIGDFFTGDFVDAFEDLGKAFEDLGDFVVDDIGDFFKDDVLGGLTDFGGFFGKIGGGVVSDVETAFIDLGTGVSGVTDVIGKGITDTTKTVGKAFEDLGKGFISIFGKRRRRRAAGGDVTIPTVPPTCSDVATEEGAATSCLYYVNAGQCPCEINSVAMDVNVVCPRFAAAKTNYLAKYNEFRWILSVSKESLNVEFLAGTVDKSRKVSEDVYTSTFEVLVGDRAVEYEAPLGVTKQTLKTTVPGVIEKAIQTLRPT